MEIFARPTPRLLDSSPDYAQALGLFDGFLCHRNPAAQHLFPLGFKAESIESLEVHFWRQSQQKSVRHWIVLNEAVGADGLLRWGQLARRCGGWDYPRIVALFAKRYLSGELWVSDTGLHLQRRWEGVQQLAEELGLGVGLQVHWDLTQGWRGEAKRVAGLPLLRHRLRAIGRTCPVALPEITVWEPNPQRRTATYQAILEAGTESRCRWAGIWVPTPAEHWGTPAHCHYLEDNHGLPKSCP